MLNSAHYGATRAAYILYILVQREDGGCNEWRKKKESRKAGKKERRSKREQGADINFGGAAAATLIKPRF